MKTKIALLALALALTACGKDNGHKAGPANGRTNHEELKDDSNKSSCSGAASPGATLFSTYRKSLSGESVQIEMALTFQQSSVTLTDTCAFPDGTTVVAQVSAPIQVTGNQISFLAEVEHTENKDIGGNHYDCSAALHRGNVNWRLTGDCLEISVNGQAELFTK
jgi:hypothetical protein